MNSMSRIALAARDGHPLVGYRFDPPALPKGSIVIAPAMAVPQSFYAPFARYLAAQGYAVWTFDYRGTGESRKGSMRGIKADLTDWIVLDYDAVVNAAADAYGDLPVFAVGHSFGGQSAPLLPSRARLAGLVNIAVGSGSLRHNTPRIRRTAPLMWHLMAPLLCPLFGYFPGALIGVIGDVPTGAMFQWRRWCLTPDYILSGEPGAREAYASAEFPVLALTFADDELLLEAGSIMLHAAYKMRRPDYRLIAPQQFGLTRIGHFGFFKPQSEATLWPMVTAWIERLQAARFPDAE
jgi:predicted alpha/beta hydrolase